MIQHSRSKHLWVLLWRSVNRLDGVTEHIVNGMDCLPKLFYTRVQAIAFREEHYADLRRKDLRSEPHGWRLPRPVRATIKAEGRKA